MTKMMQLVNWARDFICFNRKFLVYNLVSRNLKIKYRRSFLGVFWTLLAPLLSALIYYLIFKMVIKIQRPNYLVLLISGVMYWNYFSQTVSEGISLLIDRYNLISKIYLPIQVFSLTGALTNLITLIFALPVIVAIAMIQGHFPTLALFNLLFYLPCIFLITYSCTSIVSIAYVFFRDLKQLITLILQLLFYGTPILYTADMIPEKFRWILALNPLGHLILGVQSCFVNESEWKPEYFYAPFFWALGLSILSYIMVRCSRKAVVENI